MVPGQQLAVRQQAAGEVAELVSAWEVLKNMPWQSYTPPPPSSRSRPRPQPVPAFAHPQSGARRRSGSASAPPLPNRAVAISFLIAAVMMLAVVLLCVGASATGKSQKSAQFRILSAPWCQVELDSKALGPSGQAKAFEATEGRHTLTLRRDGKVLRSALQLPQGQETLVWVQFEKGQIDVSQQ
jgi:outer membrane murein-binding lipoprotein Lpp